MPSEGLPLTSTPSRSSSNPFARFTRSNDGSTIRAFTRADVDQVAALWLRCFRHEEDSAAAPAALREYFIKVLLENPWFDPELAPLVLDHHGEVAGFIGRMARPMSYGGRPIRCAIATQLMVDPRKKLGFAALELVRTVQNGPQDLCFSDGANESSVRVWERCGGQASRLLSFEWTRPLRPMQYFTLNLREHPRVARLARIAHPVCGAFDACAVRLLPRFYHKPRPGLSRQLASPEQMLPLLQQVNSNLAVHPIYTIDSYRWILQTAAEAKSFGPMRSVVVIDDDGQPIGWFIYFVQAGGAGRVLQMGATYGQGARILAELFRDAWEQDAAVVTGPLDPVLLTNMSNSHSYFRCTNLGVLVHAKDSALLSAVQRGDAYLSRLEGEWWMRFGIDRAQW